MLRRRRLALGSLFFVLLASTTVQVAAQAVIQSYGTSEILHVGTIVKLVDKDPTKIEPVTLANESKMFGVVVNANVSPVTLSQNSSATQAYVATNGDYPVLVDSQNGSIGVGDYVSVSSLSGIGRKASSNDKQVLGKAVTAFQGGSDSVGPVTVKDASGQNVTFQLGLVTVSIGSTHNPLNVAQNSGLPSFLQNVGQSIASKPVSAPRVYAGLIILVLATIIAGSLLFGGIRSSITAIGRNPLSKKSIIRGLFQVIMMSLVVLLIGLFGVYLLLKV